MTKSEQYPAELIERRDVSATLAVFRFLPAKNTTFTAGQYATVTGSVTPRAWKTGAQSPNDRVTSFQGS